MAKYRKKPVVIEAVQYNGDNLDDIIIWSSYAVTQECKIVTLEGMLNISVGDYIIKGVKGEYYPCKPAVFQETYEEYDD